MPVPIAPSPSREGGRPLISVLVATHNGAKTLDRVLAAYTQLNPPHGGWELIVVDNASTDATPSILEGFLPRLPLIYLRTEKQGKNIALNLGLAHIRGDLIVLTDDDIIPDQDWLNCLAETAAAHSSYDILAGPIQPVWPVDCPEWLERVVPLGATYGVTPPELKEGPIPTQQAWGGNMAVRRAIFDAGHRFNEQVGPMGGQYIMGSEVEFTNRLESRGHLAWFASKASVQHIIRENQTTPDWILQRAYRLGRHMFHQEKPTFEPSIALFRGAPRWKYRRLAEEQLKAWIYQIAGHFDKRFKASWEVAFLRGYLAEAAGSSTP